MQDRGIIAIGVLCKISIIQITNKCILKSISMGTLKYLNNTCSGVLLNSTHLILSRLHSHAAASGGYSRGKQFHTEAREKSADNCFDNSSAATVWNRYAWVPQEERRDPTWPGLAREHHTAKREPSIDTKNSLQTHHNHHHRRRLKQDVLEHTNRGGSKTVQKRENRFFAIRGSQATSKKWS